MSSLPHPSRTPAPRHAIALALACAVLCPEGAQAAPDDAAAVPGEIAEVTVTARRRAENLQDVPIAVSVLGAGQLESTGTQSIQQVTQFVPTLQLVSSNPRNTSVTIRGLGSSFGLTNDGLEPGVGVYVDQVYNSRPAAATFDLVDLDRLEVLRGPQGTLFGKNTTAGALNISTRAPTFTPEARLLASAGSHGLAQAQASLSGPVVADRLAGRLSLAYARRDGLLRNVTTGASVNEQDNVSVRAQLLLRATDALQLRFIGDYADQDLAECCTQVFVRAGRTLKPASQQFWALAAGLGYAPPSLDPFDRKADVDSDLQAKQQIGGASLQADWDLGTMTARSITSWRFWRWRPESDRDLTRLSILTTSKNASDQDQWSQELQLASNGDGRLGWTAGLYLFGATVDTVGATGWGADASYWLIGPGTTPALLDGYRADFLVDSGARSQAAYAQATWRATDRIRVTPGVRWTRETKRGTYDQRVSGGLQTGDATLVSRRNGIARAQYYGEDFSDGSITGQLNAAIDVSDDVLAYATVARGFKSGGINLNGIPVDAAGNPSLSQALVKPERVSTVELGLKSRWLARRLTLNGALFRTDVRDYQTNVVDTGPGALRGYIANAGRVRVQGVELEASFVGDDGLRAYLSGAYTDGRYASFANAPCPLERIGSSTSACDLGGRPLPAISKWAVSAGAEYARAAGPGASRGEVYVGVDGSWRTRFSSDSSDSIYAQVPGYALVNLRVGYRSGGRWETFAFVRNALDRDYLQFLSVQPGNSGGVFGLPGDPRSVGVTFRYAFDGS